VGIVIVMPQLMTTIATPPQTQTQQPPPQQQPQGYLKGQEKERLKQQDPEFARFDQKMTDCAGTVAMVSIGLEPEPGDPSIALCMQEIQRGLQTWCGPVNTPNYHQVKCETVHGAQDAF
jgi:hypothetical protein